MKHLRKQIAGYLLTLILLMAGIVFPGSGEKVLASLVSFGYGIYIAFQAKGNAGLEVGSLGLLSFMLSVIGLVIGLLSFKEEDKFYTFSRAGSLMCGIFAIFMVAVLMMGIV